MHVRRDTGDRGQDIKGCRASGVNSRRIMIIIICTPIGRILRVSSYYVTNPFIYQKQT
jgi:hypothetical protein